MKVTGFVLTATLTDNFILLYISRANTCLSRHFCGLVVYDSNSGSGSILLHYVTLCWVIVVVFFLLLGEIMGNVIAVLKKLNDILGCMVGFGIEYVFSLVLHIYIYPFFLYCGFLLDLAMNERILFSF